MDRNKKNPLIYTEDAKCTDCYKCVRHCPIKAISLKDNHAKVISEMCIHCGKCVHICPTKAKKIRNDWQLIANHCKEKSNESKTIAIVAPSLQVEFPGLSTEKIAGALISLGFDLVAEVAFAAHAISRAIDEYIRAAPNGIYLTTACPVTSDYVIKKYPYLKDKFVPFLSPMQQMAVYLKKLYPRCEIVFIGPCVGKKWESDNSEMLYGSLTFEDLHKWIQDVGLNVENSKPILDNTKFLKYHGNGQLYAMEGGMKYSFSEEERSTLPYEFYSFSGLTQLDHIFYEFENIDRKVVIELLSCHGGCINGPSVGKRISLVKKNSIISTSVANSNENQHTNPYNEVSPEKTPIKLINNNSTKSYFSDKEISEALGQIGKRSQHDELNCGGCGYDSCRNFAVALLEGMGETSMCVSYMRQLASNKAMALMKAMPNAVVVIDKNLQVVECNRGFSELLDGDYKLIFDGIETLVGIDLRSIFHFSNLFENAIETSEIIERQVHHEKKILQLIIFPIERKKYVGAIITDITRPIGQTKEIIEKTQKVIRNNLKTVQQIASLLGENAADTEIVLNSISEAFLHNDDSTNL